METLNGGAWELANPPEPSAAANSAQFTAVSCPTTTVCVAVGYYYTGTSGDFVDPTIDYQALVETLSGETWTPTTPPSLSRLLAVSCTSATSCAAIDAYVPVVESGSSWTNVEVVSGLPANLSAGDPLGVSCTSVTCLSVGVLGTTPGDVGEAPMIQQSSPPPFVDVVSTPTDQGYWLATQGGGVWNFGDAGFFGSTGNIRLNEPMVGMAVTPDAKGCWLVASDGGVFSFGDAQFYGSTGNLELNQPIVGIATTPSGHGYWLVAADGGVFSFGDAPFYGSTGNLKLNKPIVGISATQDGAGYWLVASDGGIFSFGDAKFYGSTGNLRLNKPVVGMVIDPATSGYWLVASDGGIFSFNAPFYGSTGGIVLNKPITGMEAAPSGDGYRLVATDGGIFDFGSSQFYGSAA